MAELNKILLIGRLTKDPELRYTPSGMAVTKLRMAVNHTYRNKEEKKEEVLYIDVSVFGRSAETVKKYLSKGRELFVEGRLQMNDWTDKQGQKRRDFGVVADNFQFLGGGERGGRPATDANEGGSHGEAWDGGDSAPQNDGPPAQQQEDDLPF